MFILVVIKQTIRITQVQGLGVSGNVEGAEGWRGSGKTPGMKRNGGRKLALRRRGTARRRNSIAGGKATQPVRSSGLIQIRSV